MWSVRKPCRRWWEMYYPHSASHIHSSEMVSWLPKRHQLKLESLKVPESLNVSDAFLWFNLIRICSNCPKSSMPNNIIANHITIIIISYSVERHAADKWRLSKFFYLTGAQEYMALGVCVQKNVWHVLFCTFFLTQSYSSDINYLHLKTHRNWVLAKHF